MRVMHTYQKLRAFVVSQGSKITLSTWNMDHFRLSRPKALAWKHLAYAESLLHTILGFAMVTTVAYAIPEVIHNPSRLTAFWMYIFTYLFLGLLTFLGLYQKSCTTVKVAVTAFIFLQLTVLLIASRVLGQCNAPLKGRQVQSAPSLDCKYSQFICNAILLPLFIHSAIFSTVLITYIFKSVRTEENVTSSSKKCHQFANIKIIIEEVM